MYSRSNKRAVAEAGGVQVVLDLISSSDPETSIQAAMFVKLLFSNNTIQEYASSETVRAITGKISPPYFVACSSYSNILMWNYLNFFCCSSSCNWERLVGYGCCERRVSKGSERALRQLPSSQSHRASNFEHSSSRLLSQDYLRGDSRSCIRRAISSQASLVSLPSWSFSSAVYCSCRCNTSSSVLDSVGAASVSGESRISAAVFARDASGDNQERKQHATIRGEC